MAQDSHGAAGETLSQSRIADTPRKAAAWRCYLCGEPEAERVARNVDFGLDIFTCLSCGLTQTDYVREDDLENYYQGAYSLAHGRTSSATYSDFSRRRGLAQRRFIEQASGRASFGSVLDYGAGAGGGVRAFAGDAERLVAWDPDPAMRTLLRESGACEIVAADDLFSGAYDGAFDLIILSHVFEHLPDPRRMLGRLHALLKDDGVLFIEVPCETPRVVRDIALRLKTGAGHLFHFNRVSLRRMAETDGLFRCESLVQCGPPAASFLEGGCELDPDAGENADGVWLRGAFVKTGSGAAPKSREPDREAWTRRFAALGALAAESASLRAALRRIYGGFLNMVEHPSKHPGVRDAVGDEGPASEHLLRITEAAFSAYKAAEEKADMAQARFAHALGEAKNSYEQLLSAAVKGHQAALSNEKAAFEKQRQTLEARLNDAEAEWVKTSEQLAAAERKILRIEEQNRRLAQERDLYRNSTSYKIGRFILAPIGLMRGFTRPRPAAVPVQPAPAAEDVEILIACHDTSMSTGSPRPVLSYAEVMKARGRSVRILALQAWDRTMKAAKPLPPAKKIIVNSVASLQWRAIRDLLEARPGNVWLYLHETEWAMKRLQHLSPEGYETFRRAAPEIPLLAVSQAQKRYFEAEFGAANVTVIRNVTQNANLDPALVRAGAIDTRAPLIVMIGTIQARKGVDLFSKVADMAKARGLPWRFRWIGRPTGDDGLYLSENVDWAGVLEGEALADAYRQASLFFLPSMDDPFPLASLEAMSYGVNVVCYRHVGAAEILGDLPGSIVFDAYAPEDALAAIEKALAADSDGMQIFETVKSLVDPDHFADVVNLAIGCESGESTSSGDN